MFYPDHFVDRQSADSTSLVQLHWQLLAQRFHLQAILLLRCSLEHDYFRVESAFGVPVEPFNGADKEPVAEMVKDCFAKHAKPHVHATSGKTLPARMLKFNQKLSELHRVWFYPLKTSSHYFIFLGFTQPDAAKVIDPEFDNWLAQTVFAVSSCLRVEELYSHVKTTELFVKEVGHDITSSVQATVAKLRNIIDRRTTGDAILRKAREIEEEMWAAFRVSESLGIVVDPDYELKEPETFNLIQVLDSARDHYLSEAQERHMRLIVESTGVLNVWGDKKAIKQAVGYLLSNAIKYGEGGSFVNVSATERRDDVLIRVANKGIPLPAEPELYYIWDFGVRGRKAKELHVNGSGIGLYSVKKIVSAHRGKTASSSENGITTFFIHLLPEAKLKKEFGLLV